MEFSPERYGRTRSERLVAAAVLLFLCLVFPAFSQDAEFTFDELPLVTVSVTPESFGQYDWFAIIMIVDHSDPETLTITEPEMPEGITLLKGPDKRPYLDTQFEGERQLKNKVVYTFRADEPGRKILGGFRVTAGEREQLTDPLLIEIGLRGAAHMIPFDVRWTAPSLEVFEGESVPLILEIARLKEIVFPEDLTVTSPQSGMFEEVGGIGDIRTESVGNTILYTVPVAPYLFTPTQHGRAVIPAAQVRALGMTRKSGNLVLQVKPLPERVKSTGAVGSFSITSWIDRQEVSPGEAVEVFVEVRGEGNLNYLQLPEPSAENMIITEKHESSSIVPSANGYSGSRRGMYRFLPESPGDYEIIVPQFPWLNPKTGEVRTLSGQKFAVTVAAAAPAEGDAADSDEFPFSLMELEEIEQMEPVKAFSHLITYLAYLPGPIALLIVLFYRRKKKSGRKLFAIASAGILFLSAAGDSSLPEGLIAEGTAAYLSADYESACTSFSAALDEADDNAGILYNYGLSAYQGGRSGEAIRALRRAIWLKPMNRQLRATLAWMQDSLDLDKQVPLSSMVHPDIIFFLSLLSVNLSFILAIGIIRKRRGFAVIMFILSVFLALGTTGSLAYTLSRRSGSTGVISAGPGMLRKIPRSSSQDWISLNPGTAVRILAESGDFMLIETGYGLQGWLLENDLLRE